MINDECLQLLEDIARWRGAYGDSGPGGILYAEELFYSETGLVAPGRSVPPEMWTSEQDHSNRMARWKEWCQSKNDDLNRRLREILARGRNES